MGKFKYMDKCNDYLVIDQKGGNVGKDDFYDVIVIGAGPAGSEFAYRLSKRGFKVLVLEKDMLDREKPCGGGIPMQEIVEFGKLPDKVVERNVTAARIISPGNSILEMKLSRSAKAGAIVKRSVYDSFLQKRAKDTGAIFLEKCKVDYVKNRKGFVEVVSGKKRYLARLVADASGYPCSIKGISRHVGDKDIVATYHVWIKMPEKVISKKIGSCIEMYCGSKVVPKGYAWIFPKKDVVSVGIGAMKDTILSEKLSLKKLLGDFIKKHPVASKKLKGGKIIKTGGGLIPVALLPKLYSGNIIFIGDAGGFANPLHAGGIYQARKSAVIASKHCIRFLRAKNGKERRKAIEDYDNEARMLFHEQGNKFDIKLRNFFWNDGLLNKVVERAKKEKRVKDAIGTLLSMTMPRERSYNILESEMLDIIHDSAAEKVEKYKGLAEREMKLFKGKRKLDRLAMHSLFGDAKRLRVSLVLLSCDLFRGNLKKAAKLAPVYELLHTASLVHDDIIDDSKTRRGKKTLHDLYGVNNAIIAGDFLIGKTYNVLSNGLEELNEKQKADILGIIGNSTEKCCHGQMLDMELAEKRKYSSINDYLGMISLKTGSMIKGAMKKGAVIADADAKDIETMGRIGENIGIAFQIINDSIDLLGNNSSKYLHNDIRNGKITPMLVHSLKNSGKKDRMFLLSAIGNKSISTKEIDKILELYRKAGAIEYSQRLSGIYVDKARKDITRLKGRKDINREAVGVLEEVVDILGYWGMLAE